MHFQANSDRTPYLPPEFAYPQDKGRVFRLLAQLNFEQLPKLPDFPETGILQIYIADNDMLGMNRNAMTVQSDFRIVYHSEIVREEGKLQIPPPIAGDKYEMFPIDGEFVLYGELEQAIISTEDFRFEEQVSYVCSTLFSAAEMRQFNVLDEIHYIVSRQFRSDGHHIGGYPVFIQGDPREAEAQYRNHTVLLLQIDSDHENGIMFGDSGVANFFITPEALQARDFSNVLYTWDCF